MSMLRKITAIICTAAAMFTLTACGGAGNSSGGSAGKTPASDNAASSKDAASKPQSAPDASPSQDGADKTSAGDKSGVLVAYFSCTGNTKKLAEYAAEVTGGTLYEIVPAEPYTDDDLNYNDKNSRSTKEMNDPACRPAINGRVDNFDDYKTVFIAYPIWWGEAPRIAATFVESYDFSGKTVVPFCTSGSSGIGSSAKNLKALTDGADWLDGARHKSSMSKDEMADWIKGLGLDL